MGIVREPDGVDLIVASGRWSSEESAEAAIWLAGYRQGRKAVQSPDEIANAVAKLPLNVQTQLIRKLSESASDSLTETAPRQRTKREKTHA